MQPVCGTNPPQPEGLSECRRSLKSLNKCTESASERRCPLCEVHHMRQRRKHSGGSGETAVWFLPISIRQTVTGSLPVRLPNLK